MKEVVVFLMLCILFVFFLACSGDKDQAADERQTSMRAGEVVAPAGKAVDPICGMLVNMENAQYTAEYKGNTYYFCMEADKVAFLENPEKYLTEQQN